MSHIVQIQTEVRDAAAVAAACRRLGLAEPTVGTARLFEGEASGVLVKLKGWAYPVVVDTAQGDAPVRQLRGRVGRREGTGPVPAGVCRGEGDDRGTEAGAQREGVDPGGRLDPAGRSAWEVRHDDHRDHRRSQGERDGSRRRGSPASRARRRARFVERALGKATGETLTAEYYRAEQEQTTIEQRS